MACPESFPLEAFQRHIHGLRGALLDIKQECGRLESTLLSWEKYYSNFQRPTSTVESYWFQDDEDYGSRRLRMPPAIDRRGWTQDAASNDYYGPTDEDQFSSIASPIDSKGHIAASQPHALPRPGNHHRAPSAPRKVASPAAEGRSSSVTKWHLQQARKLIDTAVPDPKQRTRSDVSNPLPRSPPSTAENNVQKSGKDDLLSEDDDVENKAFAHRRSSTQQPSQRPLVPKLGLDPSSLRPCAWLSGDLTQGDTYQNE